jgi:hypothetical protein
MTERYPISINTYPLLTERSIIRIGFPTSRYGTEDTSFLMLEAHFSIVDAEDLHRRLGEIIAEAKAADVARFAAQEIETETTNTEAQP